MRYRNTLSTAFKAAIVVLAIFITPCVFGQQPPVKPSGTQVVLLGTGTPGSGLAPLFQAGGARSLQVSLRFKF